MLDVLQGSEYGSESVAFTQSNNRGSRVKFVGRRANLKTGVTRKESTPNFSENINLSPPYTHTHVVDRCSTGL